MVATRSSRGSFRFYADIFIGVTAEREWPCMRAPHKIGSIAVNNLAAQSFGRFDFKSLREKKNKQKKNKGEIGKATWAIKNGHVRANLLEKTISA